MALLLRFFDPRRGRVTIGGIDARDLELDSLRAQIAVVATDAELVAAASAANVHAFVAALPDGYDTRVGERGLTRSGGIRCAPDATPADTRWSSQSPCPSALRSGSTVTPSGRLRPRRGGAAPRGGAT